ncbi:YhcN/YlaJ family sporulation lipoprotein [Weizmannia acidilactici]|uniref:YhcN/YlaJ family sporulation lipoprotein n=1 Tax=Weizmannia acidilactici TaxID=2607726 RepID=UPI00124E233E|nr:YhcN/YlaJ family sporulation lipoprotein [Weizmannia acidilactici]GER72265.1 lipoprotein YhcN [Weizmannia acidilactici]
MKAAKTLLGIGLASGLLIGCGNNNNRSNVDNNNTRPVRYDNTADNNDVRYNNVRYNTRNDNGTNNTNLLDNDANNNMTNTQNVRVANKIARRVEDLKEVDKARVIATDDNAYVAVLLDNKQNNDKLNKSLKNKIAKVVKQTDKSIDDVYVSENPDFFDQMNDYVNDFRNGRPISGFFDQFNDTVQRVFPNGSR